MDNNAVVVFHGFLSLPNREKMEIVNAINEYFDSNEREVVRAKYDKLFDGLDIEKQKCPSCGRA